MANGNTIHIEQKEGVATEEDKDKFRDTLKDITDHIEKVREIGCELADKLIDEGELELARKLLERVFCHDVSKFSSSFIKAMNSGDKEEKKLAIDWHRTSERHHLSYFNGDTTEMSTVDLAEFSVDLISRAQEFCTDVRDYLKKFCLDRDISANSYFCKTVNRFFNLVVDKPFKSI